MTTYNKIIEANPIKLGTSVNQGGGTYDGRAISVQSVDLSEYYSSRFHEENPSDVAGITSDVNAAASGQDASVVYVGGSGIEHIVSQVIWSYNGTPASGNLKIYDGSNTILDTDIVNSGTGLLSFSPDKRGTPGNNMRITLRAGGPNVIAKLTVDHYIE